MLASRSDAIDVARAQSLYWSGIHLHGHLTQAKLTILVHAPRPQHVLILTYYG